MDNGASILTASAIGDNLTSMFMESGEELQKTIVTKVASAAGASIPGGSGNTALIFILIVAYFAFLA